MASTCSTLPSGCGAARAARQAFRLGLLTNLTNPKGLVFYGSLFAALLGPDLRPWVKVAAFAIIVANATLWHAALACFFATEGAQRLYRRVKGSIDRRDRLGPPQRRNGSIYSWPSTTVWVPI